MELIGTLVLPLVALYLGATHSALAASSSAGETVPVNYARLAKSRRDEHPDAL